MKRILTARRTLLSLTILAVSATAAVIASNALAIPAPPPPPATVATIVCNGLICGGTGGTQYEWIVTPGNTGGIIQVDIGVHSNTFPFVTSVAPPGWAFTVVSVPPGSFRDHFPMTNHGVATASNGSCPFIIRWQGPIQTATFTLGIDTFLFPHDAKWVTSNGFSSTFARPVGNGLGPVHSPLFDDDEDEEQ